MTDFDSTAESQGAPFPMRRPLLSLMLSLASGSMSVCANAQSAPAPAPDAAPAKADASAKPAAAAASAARDAPVQAIETVMITATRRREPAREVPMQVDTVSTEKLEQAGARTLTDYLAVEPGVDVKTQGGAGIGAITMRGVSTGDQTSAVVSTYIDDVAFGSSTAYASGSTTALDMALLDLNHIELLRGPQGTLYGAGAMGGLLKYVTNEPDTGEFSGQASLGASFTRHGAPSFTESGIVNVPLKEDVAGLRVAVFHERDGGFVDAVGPAARQNVDGGSSKGGRVSLLIEPTNRWKIRLTATGQETLRDGMDYVDYDVATSQPVEGGGIRKLAVAEPYSVRIGVAAADLEYDFGSFRLNSITSAQNSRFIQRQDLSYEYGPAIGVDVAYADNLADVHKATQEFRLTSKAGTEVEWIAGYYFDHETGQNQQYDTAVEMGDLLHASLPSTYRENALYGDLTWNMTPRFALTGGMRIARNNQTFREIGGGELVGGGEVDLLGSSADTSKTYMATAKYALTPVSNVYVRIASGYRPGGPNVVIPNSGAPDVFQPDTLWSYEGGYKADLLDKTLSLQASVYDIRWNKPQQYTAVDGINVIANGGKAQVDGMELSATYRPLREFTLVGGLAYNDARLTQAAPGLGADGAPLPNTARFSANLAANYDFSLGGRSAYVGVSNHFVGQRNAGFAGSEALPAYRLPRYDLTDLQGGVDFGKFQLALYVRNLFDKRAQIGAETNLVTAGVGGPALVNESRPITAGATLTAKF